MSRYIDADALMLDIVEAGQANKGGRYKIGDFWELNGAEIRTVVDAQPTIDAVPVKRGKWTVTPIYIKCSECGESFMLIPQNYCPNCGARMDEE